MRQRSLEYVNKVAEDIKTLDESRRFIKEKEKQKGKRKEKEEKIKKERGCGYCLFPFRCLVASQTSTVTMFLFICLDFARLCSPIYNFRVLNVSVSHPHGC